MKRLLAVGPHTDDIELGCGGTVCRALRAGWEVEFLVFSIAQESVPEGFGEDALRHEAQEAAAVLGVKTKDVTILDFPVRHFPEHRQDILDHLVNVRQHGFDIVLCPSPFDVHQDHGVVYSESIRAFKSTATLLGYDVPWNSASASAAEPTTFITFGADILEQKIAALGRYRTQVAKARPYFSTEYITAWAKYRGVQVGKEYAEAFHALRVTI